ncbi:efflux RND transporter permease subunit [Bacillus sp. BRMEA1]|uniref:efflux RND transporter permease subunit n=1 Tax=Neobacillus endophyticus TaxID=2738405 RepID=UPI001563B8DF|nr:efflux RND transporter permease subunit [Neobacillus endophyticus]NRD79698.1 efflux RND transporter permease subunit [Neobacillus endophyticus]
MQRLIDVTRKRAILIVTMIMLIVLWGAMSAVQIQRDYLPEINNPTLMVSVRADQFQADQIKAKITDPIQQALRVVNGLEDVETDTFNGGTVLSLNFPMNYKMEQAELDVSRALDGISLPIGVEKPLVTRLSTHSLPIMRIHIEGLSPNITENMLRTSIQEGVVSQLKTVPGVKDIHVTGGGSAGFAVNLRTKDLDRFGLTVEDVKQSLEENYTTGFEGDVTNNQISIPIQVVGWNINQQDLLNLPIHAKDGKMFRLLDVADISNRIVNLQTISRYNGKPSVLLDLLKTPSSNITDVSKRIKSKIKAIPEVKNHDIHVSVQLDQGELINQSLYGLIKEGLLGSLFSIICVFLFFRQVRSTLLIAITLPICLLTTIGVLNMMDISLNLLTLSGLIVAMGRVLDDSIVIFDNMTRKVSEAKGTKSSHLLADAVSEMIPAIVSSTLTTVAVYIPIALVSGMVSEAFSGFAWSVVISLILSLLVSIFVVPALYNLFWKGKPAAANDNLVPIADKILVNVFKNKKKVVITVLVLFCLSLTSEVFLPVEFLPARNPVGNISVQLEMPQNSSLMEVNAEVQKAEAILKANPRVESFSSGLGSSFTPQSDDVFDTGGGWIQQPNIANLSIAVKQRTNVDAFISELQKQLSSLSNKAIYTVSSQNMSGDDTQIKINLTGADNDTLESAAQSIRNQLKLVPGLAVNGAADAEDRTNQYQIQLNRKAIESNGVKLRDVINRIQQYTSDGTNGFIMMNQNEIPIVLHTDVQKDYKKDIFSLMAKETFLNNKGKKVTLDQLALLLPSSTSAIQEKDSKPYASVTATIISRDIEKVTNNVKDMLKKLPLPQNVHYSFAGAPQQVYEMIYEMAIALFFSLLIVLLIISALFRGWKAPLSVLLCLPLAFIGSVIGMTIFRLEWNLPALVGMMMLTGIVVTNGIVLVDKIERNIASGLKMEDAIFNGTLSRTRPILTTALTTVLALLPLSLSTSTDTVISQTLGIVVIGGLISSTFISLFVIPLCYHWLHRFRLNSKKVILRMEKITG